MRRRVEPLGLWLAVVAMTAMSGCEHERDGAESGAVPPGSCTTVCGPQSCGEEDGCGGRCECAKEASCLSCPLRLVRVGQTSTGRTNMGRTNMGRTNMGRTNMGRTNMGRTNTDGDKNAEVTIAVESSAVAGTPLPRLAELQIAADGPQGAVELLQVAVGPSLAATGKRLHRFTETDLPWQRLTDGSYRILVFSARDHAAIGAGRWLTMRFAIPESAADRDDVAFSIVRRPGLVAPEAADLALQDTRYESALRVPVGTREVTGE